MGNNYADGNLVAAAIVDKEAGLALGDRTFVGNHPALTYLGSLTNRGSGTITRSLGDFGLGTLTSVAEAEAIAEVTDFNFDELSATVARQAMKRSVGQLLGALDPTGTITNPQVFAFDAVGAYSRRLTQLVATLGATFTRDVSPGSGVALDWETVIEASAKLEESGAEVEEGSVMGVFASKQWADLRKQLTQSDLSAALAHVPEAYRALVVKKMGYKGRFFGVDVYTTSHVPKDAESANHIGCMLAPHAIAWADAEIAPKGRSGEMVLQDGKLHIYFDFDADKFVETVYYNAIFGASKGVDDAGVTITSGV